MDRPTRRKQYHEENSADSRDDNDDDDDDDYDDASLPICFFWCSATLMEWGAGLPDIKSNTGH